MQSFGGSGGAVLGGERGESEGLHNFGKLRIPCMTRETVQPESFVGCTIMKRIAILMKKMRQKVLGGVTRSEHLKRRMCCYNT